ncbi:DUF3427 domain-containing protein [Yersinia enterocolitica]|uniref:HNH endonuclease n=1 Tax=Yersinia enterocolitica TaxID=630 RepID=UPI0030D37EF6
MNNIQTSDSLVVGQVYTRNDLKKLFNITDATINTGIFQPKNHASIWLFITEDKTTDRTQYHDLLEEDTLSMQGQTSGRKDDLIISHMKNGLEIILFYRKIKYEFDKAGFRYEGNFSYKSHLGDKPTTFLLNRINNKKFKHGNKRTWELAIDAITSLGGSATQQDILKHIATRHSDYIPSNLAPDLTMLSVNQNSRVNLSQNINPRRTDGDNQFDRLFKLGSGVNAKYEFYDPTVHGVWEIYLESENNKLAVRSLNDAIIVKALEHAQKEAEASHAFDATSVEDQRKKVLSNIVRRQGQPAFRKALLEAYEGKCAITGCTLTELLEAAHIHPYKGTHTNVVSNGLLLRADIHTLFDLRLINIDPDSLNVFVSEKLVGTDYEYLQNVRIRSPNKKIDAPSYDALKWRLILTTEKN